MENPKRLAPQFDFGFRAALHMEEAGSSVPPSSFVFHFHENVSQNMNFSASKKYTPMHGFGRDARPRLSRSPEAIEAWNISCFSYPGHPGRQTTRARWESQWFQFDDQTSSTGSESLVPYLVVCLGSLLWNHPEPLKDRERLLSGSGERLVRRQGNVLKPKDQLYLYGSCPTSSVLRPPKTHLKQPS